MKCKTNANAIVIPKELVTVTVSASAGAISGYEIQIIDSDSNVMYTQNTSNATYDIPYGTSYTIKASQVDGYITPPAQTYVASQPLRNVNVGYKCKPIGVCIVDADGDLVDVDSWTGGSNATGVYVSDGVRFLIIAPKRQEYKWGGYGKLISNIFTTSKGTTAITDFAGSSNTDQIISQLKGVTVRYTHFYTGESGTITGAPAAEYCRAYSNGCKKAGEWYLPSAGEMNLLMINKNAINSALAKISGQSLSLEWTSTQYNDDCAWYNSWDGDDYEYYKYEDHYVRPVCTL